MTWTCVCVSECKCLCVYVCVSERDNKCSVVIYMLHAIHIPWALVFVTEVFCVAQAPIHVYMFGAVTPNPEVV